MKACVWIVLTALLVACGARAEAQHSVDAESYTEAQTLIEIEPGRRLNLYCLGAGGPTVILESGLTDPTNVWGLVQPRLSRATTACAYDRAGIGFSDGATRPSSSKNIVDDLYRLLTAAGLPAPYVLVGASAGGMHVRLFAYTYPDLVAGVVLVDPAHEDQTEGFRGLDPEQRSAAEWDAQIIEPGLTLRRECIKAAETGIRPGTAEYARCSFAQYPQLSAAIQQATERFQLGLNFQRAQLAEEEAMFRVSADQLRRARRQIGLLPLIVLTKDRPAPPAEGLDREQSRLRETRYELWKELGRQSAAMSSIGSQRVVAGAGHAMTLENPDAVVQAVEEVVLMVKSRGLPTQRSP